MDGIIKVTTVLLSGLQNNTSNNTLDSYIVQADLMNHTMYLDMDFTDEYLFIFCLYTFFLNLIVLFIRDEVRQPVEDNMRDGEVWRPRLLDDDNLMDIAQSIIFYWIIPYILTAVLVCLMYYSLSSK